MFLFVLGYFRISFTFDVMMTEYDHVPSACTLNLEKFNMSIPEQDLDDFKNLLRLSKLAPKTYENLHSEEGGFGLDHAWMSAAKDYWLNRYNWYDLAFVGFNRRFFRKPLLFSFALSYRENPYYRRATETYNNTFPNFIAQVPDDDGEMFRIHFVGLFSQKRDAIPILYLHGWPGSHLEYLPTLDRYRKKYSPKELPYDVVAVSLPGWTLSSGPPLGKNFTMEDIARIMHKLMIGLGFGSGYVCQGGDLGSLISKIMAGKYNECKGEALTVLLFRRFHGANLAVHRYSCSL